MSKEAMEQKKQMNYTLPEGYFSEMEDKVRARIHAEEEKSSRRSSNPAYGVIKPAVLLVCMFLIIFGIGYGTMALTGTLGYEKPSEIVAEGDEFDSALDSLDENEMIEYLSETLSTAAIESFIAETL